MPEQTKTHLSKAQFQADDLSLLKQETAYKGFFEMSKFTLRHRLFAGGWSKDIVRELFCRGDAVAGIVYDPWRDEIALIEQFRVGAHRAPDGPWCLEVVAGMMDKPGESPDEVMKRELFEETGLKAKHLRFICRYLSSPGGTDESIFLYTIICDLNGAGGVFGQAQENEDIRLLVFPAQEVFAAMLNGRMSNAATLIALQWLQLNHTKIQEEFAP